MRRTSSLVLMLGLVGCAGPDADPVRVAERFHALRAAGDDRGLHALLIESDRAAVPLASFPEELSSGMALDLLSWGDAPLNTASLHSELGDTALVILHLRDARRDTLRLVAMRASRTLGRFRGDRLQWRVDMGLAEQAVLDSLGAAVRAREGALDSAAVAGARAFLAAAERSRTGGHPVDLDIARGTIREAAVAEALRVELRVAPSLTGTPFVEGQVHNPSSARVATLRLVVEDGSGKQERVELWDIPGGTIEPVRQLTRLRPGRLKHRLERIQVF